MMMKSKINKIIQLLLMAILAVVTTSCRETFEHIFSDDIEVGEEVKFTTALPSVAATRTTQEDYNKQMEAYQAVNKAYEFTIDMYEGGNVVGTSTYQPAGGDSIGTLSIKSGATPLYWTSITKPYAFMAVAGTKTLEADQSSSDKWLFQDRLEGYGYVQLWDTEKGKPTDSLNALNYHTAKDWKALNAKSKMVKDDDDSKKVSLYLQHKRSLITIILKAGEGVSREALAYNYAQKDLSATIYSYDGIASSPLKITPLASEELINYDADKNGGVETGVSSTRYDAIVEPYNYTTNATSDTITRISLSGQNYSFCANNDANYSSNSGSYNLEAGKHLIITITLSRESRKVLMSAYIEDWTEEVTTSICDDYGNAGAPIKIDTRDKLIDFLKSDNNKAGNVALITENIDLESTSSTYDEAWSAYSGCTLKSTMNLGGKTLYGNHRFLEALDATATLQNGTIQIGGTVDAAVARTNDGVIESIRVTTSGTTASATTAGMVVSNTGTISKCSSALMVSGGTSGYVGGIAATSLSSTSKIAIIENCTVTNRVDGGTQKGGGIVGSANGYINNNTFEYGITLNQDKDKYKNIVGEKSGNLTFKAENNAWPTVDENAVDNATKISNVATDLYSGIIDCQDELKSSTSSTTYNVDGKRYRLAKNITVTETTGNVNYELEGNNKTITTSAQIFNAVTGKVHDLTVYVNTDLIATPDEKNATDGIAPLAFEVHGSTAEISNIKVKMKDGTRIQAANPAGVVVWAWDEATVSNCEVKANIQAWVSSNAGTQARKYAGGIVSTVSRATITQCVFHSISNNNTLTQNLNTTYDNTVIDNGLTTSKVIYYGGIVGGVEKKSESTETPELTITDCVSFVSLPSDVYHGCILGYALYNSVQATSKNCQGNWWQPNCNGVGTPSDSDTSLIGKRNGVTPTEKSF